MEEKSSHELYLKQIKQFEKKLPKWAYVDYDHAEKRVAVDPDVVYPLYARKLDWDSDKLNYWQLLVIRKFFTYDLRKICGAPFFFRVPKSKHHPKYSEAHELKKKNVGQRLDWRALYFQVYGEKVDWR